MTPPATTTPPEPPPGSAQGTFACPVCGRATPHRHDTTGAYIDGIGYGLAAISLLTREELRAENAALRERVELLTEERDAALEKAARVCDRQAASAKAEAGAGLTGQELVGAAQEYAVAKDLAAAIRALKRCDE